MAPFDAELYLRRLGEHALLGVTDDRHGWNSRLNDAAAALVAVGALTPERAREVLTDYAAAEAARDAHGRFLMGRLGTPAAPPKPKRPAAARMVALDEELQFPDGVLRLRYVMLGDDRTEVSAVYTALPGADTSRGVSWIRNASGMPSRVPKPVIGDDRGQTSPLEFGGSGNDEHWDATFTTDRPIASDTRWIELFDRRIELTGAAVPATIDVQPLEATDPAHRHLWRRVALRGHHFSENRLGPTIDALTAAGAVAPDDPVIDRARRVEERIPSRFPSRPAGGARGARGAPEPWPSLLRRAGREDGPVGIAVVGAVTPEFDGHFAAVYCVESGAAGFQLEVAVSPPDVEAHPGNLDLEDRSLVWWARDDLGNHYLGSWNGSSADDVIKTGTLAFVPALDPLAARLEVLPTGLHERAVISFALPWERP